MRIYLTASVAISAIFHVGYSFLLPATITVPACPHNWHLHNGYCYKGYGGSSDLKTWFEARGFCEAMGAHLLSVHSTGEENFAFSHTVIGTWAYSSFWIGLNDLDAGKGYKWTDGSSFNYAKWGAREPHNFQGTDDCVAYNKNPGYWSSSNCNVTKPFICKIQQGFAVIPKCPYAWYPNTNDPNSTSCYLITQKIKRSWQDAQTFCEFMDGSLFKIDSISERTWIFNILKQLQHAGFPSKEEWWIGLHDNPRQTDYIWIDKTQPDQSLLPWAAGEQTGFDRTGACIEYYNGTLRHQDCSTQQYFVCERPQSNTIWCDALNHWENINNMCYKLQSKLLTWDDARSECQRENGDLFVAKDRASEFVLHNYLEARRSDLWIGLRAYQNASGAVTYRWDGSRGDTLQLGSTTDYFGVQHPEQSVISSNGSVSCVIANHTFTTPKLWQPADCSARSFFICQKPEDDV